MKPPPFEYYAPTDIGAALAQMADCGDEARFIAGGQSLVPMLNLRLAAPVALIDLNGVDALKRVEVREDGALTLGAMVRTRQIETDPQIAAANPLLSHAVTHVAHVQIRNRGTIGGSIAHADPAAELPGIALVCDAIIHIRGSNGERKVAAVDFFEGIFSTAVQDGEMITHIQFPAWPAARCWGFQEVSRRDGDFAMIGIAAWFDTGADGGIADARLVAIGADDTPVRLPAAEKALLGGNPSNDLFATAAKAAMSDLTPGHDLHASAEYRREVGGTLVERVLNEAWRRT